ncbi:hypothetical protein CR970_03290 [Candidatus Saccharibacteria bacterium]|nr:MAG: hypothetical protein CR970_03290 [Candidatus Saccharibacteria bacterium]
MRERFRLIYVVMAVFVGVVSPGQVFAQSSSSPNYRVDQTFFGSGGELDAGSANYRAKQTAGELGVGNFCSNDYCAWAGFNTTDDPFLEFVVTGDDIDLGYLNTAQTATATGQFAVRTWQASGYVVRTESEPPTNTGAGGHQFATLSGPSAPTPGTEEFGINLVNNTTAAPCNAFLDFGQDPQQQPDSTFAFGAAEPGYDQCGRFQYNKGDIVARSNQSTSVTAYTVSYVFNISNLTPAGEYEFRHTLVVTSTY